LQQTKDYGKLSREKTSSGGLFLEERRTQRDFKRLPTRIAQGKMNRRNFNEGGRRDETPRKKPRAVLADKREKKGRRRQGLTKGLKKMWGQGGGQKARDFQVCAERALCVKK